MSDTTIVKVKSQYSPRGEMGQKYLASGVHIAMPLAFPSHQGLILPVARRWPAYFDGLAMCVGATMPDVVKAIAEQTHGLVSEGDFYPLPCAHPNCHMMSYLYRGGPKPVPISRIP